MIGISKVTLLLAVMVCFSAAQMDDGRNSCLCRRVRNRFPQRSEIKDIQIYPATIFCDKVEIVISTNKGLRFCLNPNLKAVKKIMINILNRKNSSTTTRPNEVTSTPSPGI